jgi:O-methyltransferase domain
VPHGANRLVRLSERCDVEAGDFFERVPSGGDIYTLSPVLHDWDDEHCSTILSNCRTAVGPKRRLLEHEAGRTNSTDFLADITMMVQLLHGRERTPRRVRASAGSGGFERAEIVRTTSPFCIFQTFRV